MQGVGKVSRSTLIAAIFLLALAKVGRCPSPLMVGNYGPPSLECGLAVVQFGQLGLNGCSLAGEFTGSLCGLAPGVNL
jgi:hypothetical protein